MTSLLYLLGIYVWVYQGCFWQSIRHDKCRLLWQAFDIYWGQSFGVHISEIKHYLTENVSENIVISLVWARLKWYKICTFWMSFPSSLHWIGHQPRIDLFFINEVWFSGDLNLLKLHNLGAFIGAATLVRSRMRVPVQE